MIKAANEFSWSSKSGIKEKTKGEIKNESWEHERNCIFQRSKTDELAA